MTDAPATEALLHSAVRAHMAGDLGEAERLYREVLETDPRHWLALTNLATIDLQSGRMAEGAAGLKASLAIEPAQPTALNNLGNALRALGRVQEAIEAYAQAAAHQPGYAEALVNRAVLLHESGRMAEAAEAYGAAADAAPTLARLRHAHGVLSFQAGRTALALAALERATALDPASPEAFNDLGVVLHDAGRAEQAVGAFGRALALRSDYVEALSNQARALHHLDRLDEALARLDAAVALAPDHPVALTHRGDLLSALGRFEEALPCHTRVTELQPDHVDAWVRRGDVLGFLRRVDEAADCYERALALDPGNAKAPFNLAAALLREGDYETGWRLYEHRWRDRSEAAPDLPGRLWLGEEEVAGQTILLHSEQGHGDTLMMLRYAPLLAARGATVLLSVQAPLERLAAGAPGVTAVIPQGQPLPPFDLRTPMMSLPLAFGTTLGTVPGASYLAAAPADRDRWDERLGPRRRPRIGLAWAGNPTHNEDRWRSLPLAALSPLAGLDADLYAVTLDVRPRDEPALEALGVIPLGAELRDYADTAGLLETLDLVITVDTSLAHLAGALGRPGFLLLAAAPDYRWGWVGGTTPWYPSLRLFRQARIGDWSGVAAAVTEAAAQALGLGPRP